MADTPKEDAADSRQPEGSAAGKPRKTHAASQTPESLEKKRQKCREYYAANAERVKARSRKWRQQNRDRMHATQRAYRQAHYEQMKSQFNADEEARRKRYRYLSEWKRKKAQSDPSFAQYQKVMRLMSRAMKKHLAGRRVTAASQIVRLLGCDWAHFVAHIEARFHPGMTWQNHGHSGWHFDHIVPLSSFDLTDEEQLKKGCHYTNVQPLWAADNIRKGGKVA